MAVTSGFFNSVNHDRLYDAEQFSSIFDGIIKDGVYEAVGDAFEIVPNEDVNDSIIIGTGRAWFDHVWVLNDTQYSVTLEPPNTLLKRIDAVVIDVDRTDAVRKASIVVVQGSYAQVPVKPTMLKEELHKQYPVAYITIAPGDSELIEASDIEYVVGTSECPLVTGVLEVINSDNFFNQMNGEFDNFKDGINTEWTTWFEGIKDLIDDLEIGNINLVNSVDNVTIEYVNKKLQVKDRGITREKLSLDLQGIIGVIDPSGWGFQEWYDYVNSLTTSSEEDKFIGEYFSSSVTASWTGAQMIQFHGILKSSTSKESLWSAIHWDKLKASEFRTFVSLYGSSKYSSMIGKQLRLDLGDDYGIHYFNVIGVNHDTLTAGGKALLTLQCDDVLTVAHITNANITSATNSYSKSPVATFVENLYSIFDEDTRSTIKQVRKYELAGTSSETTFDTRIWIASPKEVNINKNGSTNAGPGSPRNDAVYDYWSDKTSGTDKQDYLYGDGKLEKVNHPDYIKKYLNSNSSWVLRSTTPSSGGSDRFITIAYVSDTGSYAIFQNFSMTNVQYSTYYQRINSGGNADIPVIPCFCL